jgi:MoxR-like ATPase
MGRQIEAADAAVPMVALKQAEMRQVVGEVRGELIGREREVELVLAAVNTGRDLLLEGPPGTSKTTLLRAITKAWNVPLIFVEGNAELTPGRLLGHHDPARVLEQGYSQDTFEPGPLVEAMVSGGFLYFEEFNRAPEDTLNTLLTAIADRTVSIPRVGTIAAAPTFRLIGSMNPYDNVGTTRLSVSIKDRLNRLLIDYQDAEAEREIVDLRCGRDPEDPLAEQIADDAVAVTRRTREHEAVTQGSSVRGAIDLDLMARELCAVRGVGRPEDLRYPEIFLEVMLMALSGRLLLDHGSGTDPETVLKAIWQERFLGANPGPGDLAEGDPTAPGLPLTEPERDPRDRAQRDFRPKPKVLTEDPNLIAGANGQGLAGEENGREPGERRRRPGQSGLGTEQGELDDEEGEQPRADARVRTAAQEIAARLALVDVPGVRRPPRGSGDLRALRYSGAGGELDLDRTLEGREQGRPLTPGDVIVRERRRTRREVVLVVDVSGSMQGERLLVTAATVGALSVGPLSERLAVIAFWSDAARLLALGESAPPERLVDQMLGLEAAGLTNLAFPLETALGEFGGGSDGERRVVLVSDCVHNAGPDPRAVAARLPRVDVLFHAEGERDSRMAAEIARAGRGTVQPIAGYRDVAPALTRIFAPES